MSDNSALITGFFTLGGLIVGALGTFFLETAIQRRADVLNTRLHLSRAISWVWADSHNLEELMIQLAELQTRLTALGISDKAIEEFMTKANECWQDSKKSSDRTGEAMIANSLVDEFSKRIWLMDRDLRDLAKPFGRWRLRRRK